MCILLSTTSHPDYSLILIFNRDEVLDRPTQRAQWHKSESGDLLLYGLDTARDGNGTWLGISNTGRVAALTTLSRDACTKQQGSRGNVITSFLESSLDTESWLNDQQARSDSEMNSSGGLNLFVGEMQNGGESNIFAISSNRGDKTTRWVKNGSGVEGLSNSPYNAEWARVKKGKKLLRKFISNQLFSSGSTSCLSSSSNSSEVSFSSTSTLITPSRDEFLASLFEIISDDSTKIKSRQGMSVRKITSSIFLPAFTWTDSLVSECEMVARVQRVAKFLHTGVWCQPQKKKSNFDKIRGVHGGTQKQNVVLVGRDGKVTFVERTLYEGGRKVDESERDMLFYFDIVDSTVDSKQL